MLDIKYQAKGPVIVEVGPGFIPAYLISEDVSNRLENGSTYLGIDFKRKELETVSEEKPGSAIIGDFAKLPLRNGSVDEVWLMNVFGGMTNIPERENGRKTYTIGSWQYLEELSRILSPGGVVNIGEYYTPNYVASIMESDCTELGLEKEVFAGLDLQPFIEKYKIRARYINNISLYDGERPFFITLTKK